VIADNFHMLADLPKKSALLLSAATPLPEVFFEPRLVLAAIVIVVPVELVHLAFAPGMIVRVHRPRPRPITFIAHAARGVDTLAAAVVASHGAIAGAVTSTAP